MGDKESVIRTMDIGSDKQVRWLDLPEEKNPALGCRGLRVSLARHEVFHTQLRAILRAATYGNLKIMLPMVAHEWEIDAVREHMEACAQELAAEGIQYKIPPLGIMVETPAAAIMADKLAEKVDFFSIGTNDLTQYTLAIDREAQGLDEYFDACHESVFRLIEMTVKAAHAQGISVAVCGEMGGDPRAITRLVRIGVDVLSVSVPKVARTMLLVAEAAKDKQEVSAKPHIKDDRSDAAQQSQSHADAAAITLTAPVDGKIVPMEDIPDEAFATGLLGECMGILPDNGTIYAPCDGMVTVVAKERHAITFATSNGVTVLVHVGIDTVTLKGSAFDVIVNEGDQVSAGQKVMDVNLDAIKQAGLSPIVVTTICK